MHLLASPQRQTPMHQRPCPSNDKLTMLKLPPTHHPSPITLHSPSSYHLNLKSTATQSTIPSSSASCPNTPLGPNANTPWQIANVFPVVPGKSHCSLPPQAVQTAVFPASVVVCSRL